MKRFFAFISILIIAFWGCSKRENPVDPVIPQGKIAVGHINGVSLSGNLLDDPAGRTVYIYEPPGYVIAQLDSYEVYIESTFTGGVHWDTTFVNYVVRGTEYPSLYLLHGYGGRYDYYTTFFLIQDVLDEMIYNGEIEPMVVITPNCNNGLGGSFYTNSPDDPPGSGVSFGGRYEDLITGELITYVNDNFNVDTVAARRGISGHSMGGYGAIKLAMNHPDLFGSVSSMSAPLAFAGLSAWIGPMLEENGLNPDSLPDDTTWFYSIMPSLDKRLTAMMFAMGAAFSPHDLTDPDTTYFHRLLDVPFLYGVDLPFNFEGELDTMSSVWAGWLANDPLTMLMAGGHTALANTPIYLDCGNMDDLGLNYQNQAFAQALAAFGLTYQYIEYTGFTGMDANHITYIADRLRDVFRFHSQVFSAGE